eukprot:TRINITY_DN3100_c0_g2_i1.p1 TRINITY_DN3100_c0_g2~~TRINITY_DN3100_c0_g2_i1.p1  ORF type:complete len:121 (-),score=37.80 TRINITY_DN3100_c0_g2_i1:10-348(-)
MDFSNLLMEESHKKIEGQRVYLMNQYAKIKSLLEDFMKHYPDKQTKEWIKDEKERNPNIEGELQQFITTLNLKKSIEEYKLEEWKTIPVFLGDDMVLHIQSSMYGFQNIFRK